MRRERQTARIDGGAVTRGVDAGNKEGELGVLAAK